MRLFVLYPLVVFSMMGLLSGFGNAQEKQAPTFSRVPMSPASPDNSVALAPLRDAATDAQIREYLRLGGDMDSFRVRWIAALDKNRSIGSPYWPESFWTAMKVEMQKTDLLPMFVIFYQHGISSKLMQDVLDSYHTLGRDHFQGSPACFRLGDAELAMTADMDKLKLAKTSEGAYQGL